MQFCLVCQQSKYDRSKLPGLLQPLPVPAFAWHVISLDFIEGFPVSQYYNCILVVVDLLTKYGHFVALRHPFFAAGVAKAFFHNIYHLHGLPEAIISDRDQIFTSTFWSELLSWLMSTSVATRPITPSWTAKLNASTSVSRHTFVASFMRVLRSGVSGYLLRNSGTTLVPILLSVVLLWRHYMDIQPGCSLLIPLLHPTLRSTLGLLITNGWTNCCIIILTEPSNA